MNYELQQLNNTQNCYSLGLGYETWPWINPPTIVPFIPQPNYNLSYYFQEAKPVKNKVYIIAGATLAGDFDLISKSFKDKTLAEEICQKLNEQGKNSESCKYEYQIKELEVEI
jgi:hypothetical protein